MSRRRRRTLLVPEARAALDDLRSSVVVQQSYSQEKATVGELSPEVSQPALPAGNQSGVVGQPFSGSVQGVAQNLGVSYQATGNGNMTTRQAGRIGGAIGGSMIQRLIVIAEQELTKRPHAEGPSCKLDSENTTAPS